MWNAAGQGLATHPTLPYFATAAEDKTIRLWSAKPHQCLAGKTLRAAAAHLDFSPDGGSLAAGLKSGGILVLAARRTALDLTIERRGRGAAVTALRYAPKGKPPREAL